MKYLLFLLLVSCSASQEEPEIKNTTEVIEQEVKKRVISGFFLKSSRGGEFPIKDQIVVLKDHNNKKIAETKTKFDGSFEFSLDIDWGPYSIYLELEDYHKLGRVFKVYST